MATNTGNDSSSPLLSTEAGAGAESKKEGLLVKIGKFLLKIFGILVIVAIGIVIYHFAFVAPGFKDLICKINPYSDGCPLNNSPMYNMQNYTTPNSRQALPSYQSTTPMVRK